MLAEENIPSVRLDELKSKEDDDDEEEQEAGAARGSWRLSLDTRGLPMVTVCLS